MIPRPIARVFPLLLAISLVPAMLLARMEASVHALSTEREEDVYLLPRPAALELLSLGHCEAAADLCWVRALAYFGEEVALRGRLQNLTEHVDAVVGLDPEFREAYHWASVATVYNQREITRRSIEASNHYLELGIRHFPRDRELLTSLAFNYGVEMLPFAGSDAEKNALRRRAAALYERAARLGGDRGAALMAAELYTRAGEVEAARRHLRSIYAITDDPDLRRVAAERLTALVGEAGADAALALERDFFERAAREYPWLPPDLYSLVGPRRLGVAPDAGDDPDAGP